MIKVKCNNCGNIMYRSPSKIEPRNYCSRECYSETRNREIEKRGIKTRITPEFHKKFRKKAVKALVEKISGSNHHFWKGSKVGYRGLHYWLRRNKGKPTKCSQCGKKSNKPRIIQWANIDGKYRRNLDDYIALCGSCHKLKDLSMKSTLDSQIANQ